MNAMHDPGRLWQVIAAVRQRRPHVHCITNTVAQAFTANALIAFGAVPSMTISLDEIADFVDRCDNLLINLGTFDAARSMAIEVALTVAAARALPFVLDPVFVDVATKRLALANALLARRPAIVRANEAEVAALLRVEPSKVDPVALAGRCGAVVAMTGAVDRITDGRSTLLVGNGEPLLGAITASGCMAGAIVTACAAVTPDRTAAAAAGLAAVGVAAEIAGAAAGGPGTFSGLFLDALYRLDEDTFTHRVRLS